MFDDIEVTTLSFRTVLYIEYPLVMRTNPLYAYNIVIERGAHLLHYEVLINVKKHCFFASVIFFLAREKDNLDNHKAIRI